MKGKRNFRKVNFGSKLEEVVRLKDKAKVQSQKLENDYPTEALSVAKKVVNQLQKELEIIEKDNDFDKVQFANNIYKILVDTEYKNLISLKEDYDIWSDLNSKFNS